MNITYSGTILQFTIHNEDIKATSHTYNNDTDKFEAHPHILVIKGSKKAKKVEVLTASSVWDNITGLYMPYLLTRETQSTEQVYSLVRINTYSLDSTAPSASGHVHQSDGDEYDILYQFGKDFSDDRQDFWIFGGPTFVISTHASTKKHANVLISISVIMQVDGTWTVSDVDIPDLRRLPSLLGCSMVGSDIVAVTRNLPENTKKVKASNLRWELSVIDLLATKPSPPSPDLLAGDEEMTPVPESSPIVKTITKILPRDVEIEISDITAVEIYQAPFTEEEVEDYCCLLGAKTKSGGGKLIECSSTRVLKFDGVDSSPKHILTQEGPQGLNYVTHNASNKVQIFDHKKNLISEHHNVERALLGDFKNIGVDQCALLSLNAQKSSVLNAIVVDVEKNSLKGKRDEEKGGNIQAVCQSLRMRAVHAMDHLQEVNKTVQEKDVLLRHSLNMLKTITSPSLPQSPNNPSPTRTAFLESDDVVSLFDDRPVSNFVPLKEHVGPPLRVAGVEHSFAPSGDWDFTLTIHNFGSVAVTCISLFLACSKFAITTTLSQHNPENTTIAPKATSAFSLHSTLPIITEDTSVDVLIEWSSETVKNSIHFLFRVDLTPNLKALETKKIDHSHLHSYSIKLDLLLYSANNTRLNLPNILSIFSDVLGFTSPSSQTFLSPHGTPPVKVEAVQKKSQVELCILTQHISQTLSTLQVLSENLPDDIVIVPNYTTPQSLGVVSKFVETTQKEIEFVLAEIASYISGKQSSPPSDFKMQLLRQQQLVDDSYYDLLEHFNYAFNSN